MSNELVSTLALMPETKSQQEVFRTIVKTTINK